MAALSEQLARQELRNNVRDRDLIKARLVLAHFHEFPAMEQAWVIEALAECRDDFALPLLAMLATSEQETHLHLPELQELILARALNNPGFIVAQLARQTPEQALYVRIAGDLALGAAVPALKEIIMTATDTALLAAAIEALARIGDAGSVGVVAEMLYAEEEALVRCAVEALGRFATPAAMLRLAERLGKSEAIDLAIVEVFARVQDEISLRTLNGVLRSRSSVLRNHCKKKMGGIGARCLGLLVENLAGKDPDLVIDSLNLLQEIGDPAALLPVRQLINGHPRNANVRFAAYEALASLPRRPGDYVLAGGLTDPVETVRLAAARAIDHNLDEVLAAGIANMVNRMDGEASAIVRAIIDAQAGRLFLALLDNDHFRTTAMAYLLRAHADLRGFFAALLARHGREELAAELAVAAEAAAARERVCAVDDSGMILSVYRTVLSELHFEPVLFREPAEALAWLERERPLLVCTDLNMPEMTGIELIRRLRRRYGKEELPVVLVTTQEDRQDNEAAREAGANAILHKPFDAGKLGAVLMEIFHER